MSNKKALLGTCIGIAKCVGGGNPKTEHTDTILLRGLIVYGDKAATDEMVSDMQAQLTSEKDAIVPNCKFCEHPCGNTDDYDVSLFEQEPNDVRNAKYRLVDRIVQKAQQLMEHYDETEMEQLYVALECSAYEFGASQIDNLLP